MTEEKTNTANQVVNALKAIVISVLCQGYNKSSFLVINHIQYIKNIQTVNNPERYISSIAKKLFPNEEVFKKKSEDLDMKYKDGLLSKMKELYEMYYKIAQEVTSQKRKTISESEAIEILEDILWEDAL